MNYLVCQHCGKKYTAKRSDSKYCSPACRVAFSRRTKNETLGDKPQPIDWKADEVSSHRADILIDKVPKLHILIHSHRHKHGSIATQEMIEALWRLYTFVSPYSNKPKFTQRDYYEIWEHEVDKNGGFSAFWFPLMKEGKHRAWIKQMYQNYDININDVDMVDGYPKPI